MSGLPILVEGSAVRALIVGGGAVASRKAAVLLDAGASVRVVAPAIADTMRAMIEAGRVAWTARRYEPSDLEHAHLVIAATDERGVNARVAAEARTAGRLVNVADVPADGSFSTMATHRSGALVVGVSAGGVPGAAARIRDAMADRYDARYGRALAELSALRRDLLDRGEGATWRAHARALFDDGFCELVESGKLAERVATWR